MSSVTNELPHPVRVPIWLQGLAWSFGMLACLAGMVDLVGNWDREFATIQFLVLFIGPILWMIVRRRQASTSQSSESATSTNDSLAWICALLVGITSFLTCFLVGRDMESFPPTYHDEYSYLFQARTLLDGAFSVPSHPTHPELFDQMHVLNEGRMASRYYPGTGLWLSPFVLLKHPFWGHWLASSLASVFVFWTGYEIGRLRVAIISGMLCAVSPGIAIFGNMLLAHQPTLFGLCLFLWAFTKWQRTRRTLEAFWSGCGLSFAMLCRPATAAGFGLPFGIVFLLWVLCGRGVEKPISLAKRGQVLIAMGFPIVLGWCVMLAYNKDVTGSWTTSTYQLYTDVYSPRHVYGFNNVVKGEKRLGPKVIVEYDQLAENLTAETAAFTAFTRLMSSFIWTFDMLPQIICGIVVLGMLQHIDRRWTLVTAGFVSLHAIHIPYWYVGIMGWHYVFETAPLLCLAMGLGSDLLLREWAYKERWLMPTWWAILFVISLAGDYLPLPGINPPRISLGIGSIHFPRQRYAGFNAWLEESVTIRPALVLIENDPDPHVDYIDNLPGLKAPVLRGRYRPGKTDLDQIAKDFPDRAIYLCQIRTKTIKLISRPTSEESSEGKR